jgi:hypothetical protein
MRRIQLVVALVVLLPSIAQRAVAGPETNLREFASGQIKKGVRSIGMGGDGATLGNYALVYRDAGTALIDYGLVRFSDDGNTFTFTAVGFTSPPVWDDAAVYVIAMAQHATGIDVWSDTPSSPKKPPSIGDGSNQAVFVKAAKPLGGGFSLGVLLSYELSEMTLEPKDGSGTIRYRTEWRPSGGAGLAYQPVPWLLGGLRVILNHDLETRIDPSGSRSGILRSYEYRAGIAVFPWSGGILDAGGVALDRTNHVEGTSTFDLHPTLGIEQEVLAKACWLRAGLDETSLTAGLSARLAVFKLDAAYIHNLAAARNGVVFGTTNDSFFLTLNVDYLALLLRGS